MRAEIELNFFEQVRRSERGEMLLARLADRLATFISPSTPVDQLGPHSITSPIEKQK
ncbi:MAG: hypothetical protein AB7O71_10750 [Hyphomicrobiaceae bacterium]